MKAAGANILHYKVPLGEITSVINTSSANAVSVVHCVSHIFTQHHTWFESKKWYNVQKRKIKSVTYYWDLSEVGSWVTNQVHGSRPCLPVGTLDFGFVGQALAGLGVDVLVAELLPLVAVVDAGAVQRTRQLTPILCVVSNQLGYGIELCLAFLPQK